MLQRFRVLAAVAVFTTFASTAFAFLPPRASDTGSIPLPGQGQELEVPLPTAQQAKASAWGRFTEANPNWAATWNGYTGTPHRAYGQGIQITGPVTSAQQASDAALHFLREVVPFTKAAEVDLDVVGSLKGGRVWYVHFRQNHDGVQILNDDISVRLGEDGKAFGFAADVRTDLILDTRPRLDAEEARRAAIEGLQFDANTDHVHGGEQLWILPLDADGESRYSLVRQVGVTQQNPPHEWITMVDAHTGELVWRYDRVRYADVTGKVKTSVHPELPSDPLTELEARNMYVKVDGVDVTTDELGNYLATAVDGEVEVVLQIRGPWGAASRETGPDAFVSMTIDASNPVSLDHLWDNLNSHSNERDAFFSAERTHEYIKTIDPNFTNIDYQMPITVLLDGSCNAFWNSIGINFFKGGNGCNSTAKMADVVAHEYGHGINDKIYQQAGSSNGMNSGALHEGMADVIGAFLFDDPVVGNEFFTSGVGDLRNTDNTNSLPHDLIGQVHTDGQIIAGAFWDLREAIGLEEAGRLAHYAKYGLPDSPVNQRMAFREYLIETLVADDDDSDLSNGTPHWDEIITSFALHGINRSLYVVVDHANVDDPEDHESPVRVRATMYSQEPTTFPLDGATVKLFYSVDGGATQELAMTPDGAPFFVADIPAQEVGSVVRYYFEANVVGGEIKRVPANPTSRQFNYAVGVPEVVFTDNFENERGWTVGDDDDDAITGIWERAKPQLTNNGSQPGNDHSRNGNLCFVTGNDHLDPQTPGSFPPGQDDVDDGKTSLFSPVFDLSEPGIKVVRYWRLFNNNLGRRPSDPLPDDPWQVSITTDGGATWVDVENSVDSNIPSGRASLTGLNDWQKVTFRIDEYLTPTDQVQLRFVAADVNLPSLVEAHLDDFEILNFPTDIVPVLVSNFRLLQVDDGVQAEWRVPLVTGSTQFRLEAARGGNRWNVDVSQPEPGRFVALDARGASAGGEVTYALLARESDEDWTLVHEETLLVQATPTRVALHAPWPNPFNPRTTVAFSVDRDQRVKLAVYDLAGRQVKVLADGEFASGRHETSWLGLDETGRKVSSGVYFVKMFAETLSSSRKLVLLQ